jgi:hypothetical protein
MSARFVDNLPLWALFALACILTFAAIEIGFRIGAARARAQSQEQAGPVGSVVGAVLGLLAFMMAFTFSLAANRFDARKALVLDEVNAIGTAYLRAGLLPEPQRSESRRLLGEYTDLRANIGAARDNPELLQPMIERAEAIQAGLWQQATALAAADRSSQIDALFIGALNEVFDLHTKRVVFALEYRIPGIVWLVLASGSFLAMVTVGFQFGLSGHRSIFASLAIALTFSIILALIGDLDRPAQSLLSVSQQPMIDLARQLGRDN